jgi:hypothetical protein
MNKRAWLNLLYSNRKTIFHLTKEGLGRWRRARRARRSELQTATTQ